MSWITEGFKEDIRKVAEVFYIDWITASEWNAKRDVDQPRLMTGWCWEAKRGGRHQAGLKTETACFIDCWYHLVADAEPPRIRRAARVKLVVANDRKVA